MALCVHGRSIIASPPEEVKSKDKAAIEDETRIDFRFVTLSEAKGHRIAVPLPLSFTLFQSGSIIALMIALQIMRDH